MHEGTAASSESATGRKIWLNDGQSLSSGKRLESSISVNRYFQWSGDLERARLERSEGAAHAGLKARRYVRKLRQYRSLPPALGMAYTTPAVSKFCRRLQLLSRVAILR